MLLVQVGITLCISSSTFPLHNYFDQLAYCIDKLVRIGCKRGIIYFVSYVVNLIEGEVINQVYYFVTTTYFYWVLSDKDMGFDQVILLGRKDKEHTFTR